MNELDEFEWAPTEIQDRRDYSDYLVDCVMPLCGFFCSGNGTK